MEERFMKTRNIMAILLLICIGVVSCKEPSPSYIPPVETIVVVKFKKAEYKDYVLVEYDFTAGGTGFAPVVGCAWRRMPRGTYADNIISLYFRMAYR